MCAVTLLMNAKFRYWHADYCWGPRLLVPIVPSLLLPAAPWLEGALARGRATLRVLGLGALLGAGLFVQVLGSSFYWDHYIRIAIAVKDQTGAAGWFTEDLHHVHFIPQFSPLVGHAWMLTLTWDLSQVIFAREETQLALAHLQLARVRRDAADRAAQLWIERRQAQALWIVARTRESCFALLRATAALVALTGGLFRDAAAREEAACAGEGR